MKANIFVTLLLFTFMTTLPAYAQKYKSVSDTIKLNKEYKKINKDVADLTSQLTIAEKNLPGYKSKASNAEDKAHTSAESSKDKASKANNGNVKDARRAKKQAKKSYKRAKDSKSADKNVKQQQELIAKLAKNLNKKEQRLSELEKMRNTIYAKLPSHKN